MKVSELIAKLSKLEQDAKVCTTESADAEYFTLGCIVEPGWFGGPRTGEFHSDEEVEEECYEPLPTDVRAVLVA